jgi:hypothetical protein
MLFQIYEVGWFSALLQIDSHTYSIGCLPSEALCRVKLKQQLGYQIFETKCAKSSPVVPIHVYAIDKTV